MNENPESFDWGQLGEEWWLNAMATTGATELQTRFAACRARGLDQTKSAREAGYSGDAESLRQTGYRVARTNRIAELLALASAETGEPLGETDRAERRRALDHMVRHGDANAKLAAIKTIETLEAADAEAAAREKGMAGSPADTLNEIAEILPDLAVHLAAKNQIKFTPTPDQAKAMHERRKAIALDYIREAKEAAIANGQPEAVTEATPTAADAANVQPVAGSEVEADERERQTRLLQGVME